MGMTVPLEAPAAAIAADPVPPTPEVARLLEVLRSQGCSEDAFGYELQGLVESDPDAAWEFASLLDQHFRRGEIRAADYRLANARVMTLLLGAPRGTEQQFVQSSGSSAATSIIATTGPLAAPTSTDAPARAADDGPIVVPAQAADGVSLVGRTLRGRYRILREIGRGGLGTVYEAVDEFRVGDPEDQRVALKVLHPAVSARPDMLSALVREFQHVQRLSHPNIVRVHEFDRDGGIAFFTMELLHGLTLDRLLVARRRTALERRHALAIVRDIGAALAHAHANRIVHGDINLHNVFVTEDGSVRVLDFGSSSQLRAEPWISEPDSPERTRFATPQYASCELLEGGVAEVRDDMFAFACVAYVLFTGRHPYGERTAQQARTLGLRPRRPAELDRGQWRSLRDGLSLRRDSRPRDVDAWTRRFLADASVSSLPRVSVLVGAPPRRESTPRRRLAAGSVVLLALVGVWWASRAADPRFFAVIAGIEQNATRLAARAEAHIAEAALSVSSEFMSVTAKALAEVAAAARVATDARPPAPVAAAPRAARVAAVAPNRSVPSNPTVRRTTSLRAIPARKPRTVMGVVMPVRIALATNHVTVGPRDPVARVVVERFGSLRTAVQFRWVVESGSARLGTDFVVPGPHDAAIGRGRRSVALLIPIVSDSMRSRPVSFYVTIAGAGAGELIGPRTITQVTILPSR